MKELSLSLTLLSLLVFCSFKEDDNSFFFLINLFHFNFFFLNLVKCNSVRSGEDCSEKCVRVSERKNR